MNQLAGWKPTGAGHRWLRVNFPTPEETAYAAQQAMPGPAPPPLSAEEQSLAAAKTAAVVAKAAAQSFRSIFIGVSWAKQKQRWIAQIMHEGKQNQLGRFEDEREAAQAFDTAARQVRFFPLLL